MVPYAFQRPLLLFYHPSSFSVFLSLHLLRTLFPICQLDHLYPSLVSPNSLRFGGTEVTRLVLFSWSFLKALTRLLKQLPLLDHATAASSQHLCIPFPEAEIVTVEVLCFLECTQLFSWRILWMGVHMTTLSVCLWLLYRKTIDS